MRTRPGQLLNRAADRGIGACHEPGRYRIAGMALG
jgi:hypothetical protein